MRLLHTSDWHLGRPSRPCRWPSSSATSCIWLSRPRRRARASTPCSSAATCTTARSPRWTPCACSSRPSWTSSPSAPSSSSPATTTRPPGWATAATCCRASASTSARPSTTSTARSRSPTPTACSVLVYGLPYLEPEVVRAALGAEKSHAAVLTAAMDRVRADLAARQAQAAAAGRPAPRSVVMAHAFITGGQPSDSERDVERGRHRRRARERLRRRRLRRPRPPPRAAADLHRAASSGTAAPRSPTPSPRRRTSSR